MTEYRREKMKSAIIDEMGEKPGPVAMGHVEMYLDMVEAFQDMHARAKEIADDPRKINLYLKYNGEARRQERAARDTLLFLGITPEKKKKTKIPSL